MGKKEHSEFLFCPTCKLRWAPNLDVDRSFKSKLNEDSRQKALWDIRKHEFDQVNNLVNKFVKKGGRGLEVGCAYGWYLDSIGNEFQMEGIEPENSIAEQARLKGHIVYTGFFPQDMKHDVKKYDFIVFNNVWEHINHTSDLIDGSTRYLEVGGKMIITVPLSTGGLYRIAELLERLGNTKWLIRLWQLHFHSPHIYYFTKKNLEQIMSKHGFILEHVEDVRDSINASKMKERFDMDIDEKHSGIKAAVFQMGYPVIRRLPADKAVFVFQYAHPQKQKMILN